MRRTLFRLSVALATFAVSYLAADSFERALPVAPDNLVAAPSVEELRSTPAPHTMTCELHGVEMRPHRTSMEGATIFYQKWSYAAEHSRGEDERRFPNCCETRATGERNQYGEVYLLYACDRCVAAYIKWNRRYAGEP